MWSTARAVLLVSGLVLTLGAPVGAAGPVDRYQVVWDSPSRDHHGSMPLGNGDITVNAWMTVDGHLEFYIGKSDAWDDNARLVKVGKVRVRLEPNPFRPDGVFRQTLNLREGCLEVALGGPGETPDTAGTRVRLWVDAHHPVIQVMVDSARPLTATASAELWRTARREIGELQVSDVLLNRDRPGQKEAPMWEEPDTRLTGETDRVDWYHYNAKSVGPRFLAEIQGLTGFSLPDPLLRRIFGAVITARDGERLDDQQLRSPRGTSHRFGIHVLTRHPSTPEAWRNDLEDTVRRTEALPWEERWAAHTAWWGDFWGRSWIRASTRPGELVPPPVIVPGNRHVLRVGSDQDGGNRFAGDFGRISIWSVPLTGEAIAGLAALDRNADLGERPGLLHAAVGGEPRPLAGSASWDFRDGLTLEAWVRPTRLGSGGARLLDKITPGGDDGFLFDTHPGNSLRFICGRHQLDLADAVPPERWTHVVAVADGAAGGCRLYVDGRRVADSTGATVADEAAYVSQMYHLQRFITACAGRGAHPIKFNGSLFTVPPGPTEADPDYRRWGPGYWWQNTRLPYISLCTSGDFDLQQPLFRMYVDDLLPLSRYRTRHSLGHGGAFYPECIYFWGPMFSETYGWTPFAERTDKLQESGWHKWEWVGGLELGWMMLDYYDHTLDRAFLRNSVLPLTRDVLRFFEEHYPTDDRGRLVMHPSQALETWWHCTNAAPEVAGCWALTDRLLALDPGLVSPGDLDFLQRLRAKLPPIPVREIDGRTALAPAEFFADKRNIENPELYSVFPFRQFAFNRPRLDWALHAFRHRGDRGHQGWRQDDIFMAYLGLADEAREALVGRARQHDRGERFPAFWGPNYDWTPDQDHGGVLMKTFQAMLLQTDGRRIFLFPAWPRQWDVEFKLHAPCRTVVTGVLRDGVLTTLGVEPEERRADVEVFRVAVPPPIRAVN